MAPIPSPSRSVIERSIRINGINTHLMPKAFHDAPNRVRTSKYSLLSFLPINIFEQFRRLANFFFLVVIAVQAFFNVSPYPLWTSSIPLAFILGTSATKEAYEDMGRHRHDRATNKRRFDVIRNKKIQSIACERIGSGDILAIHSGQEFPADVVVLSTTSNDGTCFVNTASLDGESMPKVRKSVPSTRSMTSVEEFSSISDRIHCNAPCRNLDLFIGRYQGDKLESALGDQNFVMRGSVLVNCNTAFCVAVFTGPDTKLLLNQERYAYKFSGFERILNRCVLAALCMMFTIVFSLAAGAVLISPTPHVQLRLSEGESFFEHTLTFFVLFSFCIPMSLYVTMEFVKVGQAMTMEADKKVRTDENEKSTGIQVNSSAMNEELGRIEFIFSDKTGTLTQNKMEMSSVVIGGDHLESPFIEHQEDAELSFNEEPDSALIRLYRDTMLAPQTDAREQHMDDKDDTPRQFFLNLMTCNSLFPVVSEDSERTLVSESPDETAIADFMGKLGATIEDRDQDSITLNFDGSLQKFSVLAEMPFTSDRRRMGIIVKSVECGPIYFLVKGADSTVMPMVSPSEADVVRRTNAHMKACAQQGSRTLVMASKVLTQELYDQWKPSFQNASVAISKRLKKIEKCFEMLESDMHLLGATAIQDQLQENVRGTIARLLDAGIQIMILTGDKQETAVHIACDAGVVRSKFKLLYIEDNVDVKAELLRHVQRIKCIRETSTSQEFAMIIEGNLLERMVAEEDALFLLLLALCKTVVCSRSAPIQKALIVELVKTRWHKVCLAIGDGANDVSMIQSAHVGIGLRGKEGTQAAMNADYVLQQFSQLRRLVFVHGRYSLVRSTTTVFFSFYKNIAFPTTQVWFAIRSYYSGQSLFDGFVMTFFNLLFTSLPPLIAGVTEIDVEEDILMQNPEAYKQFVRVPIFSARKFVIILLKALSHGLVLYYIAEALTFSNDVIERDGYPTSLFVMGTQICTVGIFLVNLKMFFDLKKWYWYDFGFALSGGFLFLAVYLGYSTSLSLTPLLYGTSEHVLLPLHTYCYGALVFAICLLSDAAIRYYNRMFAPTFADALRERGATAKQDYITASKASFLTTPTASSLMVEGVSSSQRHNAVPLQLSPVSISERPIQASPS